MTISIEKNMPFWAKFCQFTHSPQLDTNNVRISESKVIENESRAVQFACT